MKTTSATTLMLIVENWEYFFRQFPEWNATVNLKCDPTRKTVEDATFDVIDDVNNPRVSQD